MTVDLRNKYDIGSDKLVAILVHLLPVICLLVLLLAPKVQAHEYQCSTDMECYEECLEVEANPEICDEVF